MKNTSKKLIVISFFLALIAAIAVFSYLNSLKNPKSQAKKITIIIAIDNIPAATLIEKKMIKEVQVTDSSVFKDYIKVSSKIAGKYTKNAIMKNEGFRSEDLLDKNSNDISAKIDSNHRAVSISVTGASAVSDLLKAGDSVDIAAYLPEKLENQKIVRPDTVKILLQNIKVLAVDKEINRDSSSTQKSSSSSSNANADNKIPSTFLVTLSVPLTDIEKLVLTEEIGDLKLALRPIRKEDDTDTSGAVWQDILTTDTSNSSGSTDTQSSVSTQENTNSQSSIASQDNSSERIVNYTVRQGDTLKKISYAFYGDKEKYTVIKDINNIQNENQILVGEVIKVPIK